MKLTFLGATETVTGSKYLIQTDAGKILVDCGLFQGLKALRLKNWEPLPTDVSKIQSVLLTHAHIDHSGYLPLLSKCGFKGKVYATKASCDLSEILLLDSAHIQEEDAKRANKYGYSKHDPALPLYTQDDARRVLKHFNPVNFEQTYSINQDLSATWYHASHILGASFLRLVSGKVSILFSGDMGRPDDPILMPPHPIEPADYLVIESTYGDRLHEDIDPKLKLKQVILETAKRGGTILIPSFAVGRAQMIMFYLYELLKENEIPHLPIYLDSPMAIEATKILHAHPNDHKLSKEVCDEVCKIAKYIQTPDESKGVTRSKMPKIIIAASGMMTGGRILHHLKEFGPDDRNTILLTGYQAVGTRGARILSGERSIKMFGEQVSINAKIESLSNMSAHADQGEMINWLSGLKQAPKHVFITHGDLDASKVFKEKIEATFGWECSIPQYEQSEVLS